MSRLEEGGEEASKQATQYGMAFEVSGSPYKDFQS